MEWASFSTFSGCCVSTRHTKAVVFCWSTLLVKVLNRPPRWLVLLKSGRITGFMHQQESECTGTCYQQCWKEARLLPGSTLASNGPPRSLLSKAWHGSSCLNSSLKDCQVSKASDVLSISKQTPHTSHRLSCRWNYFWVTEANSCRNGRRE